MMKLASKGFGAPQLDVWRNENTDTSHACSTFGPRTLCGRPIEGDNWKREDTHRYVDELAVNCNRCRRVMRSFGL